MNEPKIYCKYTELREPSAIKENPMNPNMHPQQQLEKLAEIIKINGWRQPVVVSDLSGLIVKGHGRYRAACLARYEKIPVEIQHYEDKCEETADMLSDNILSDLSELDQDITNIVHNAINEENKDFLNATGFSMQEIEDIIDSGEELLDIPNNLMPERESNHIQKAGDILMIGSIKIFMQEDEAFLLSAFFREYARKNVIFDGVIMEMLENGNKNYTVNE